MNYKHANSFHSLALMLALLLHGCLFAVFLWLPGDSGANAPGVVDLPANWFRLAAVPEGATHLFLPMSHGDAGPDNSAPSGQATAPVDEAELEKILAADRETLQAELNKASEVAMAAPTPAIHAPLSALAHSGGGSNKGPQGAIRELTLEGFPENIVNDIMARYKLQVVSEEIQGGRRGQNFLSSASKGPGEHYFGGLSVPGGVYEVFQLNRDTVAAMSQMEEDALRERGLDPLQTRVIRIVFGIVKTSEGGYDLGVKSLEAEKVAP